MLRKRGRNGSFRKSFDLHDRPNQLPAIHRKERSSDKAGWLNWQDASLDTPFLKGSKLIFFFLTEKIFVMV